VQHFVIELTIGTRGSILSTTVKLLPPVTTLPSPEDRTYCTYEWNESRDIRFGCGRRDMWRNHRAPPESQCFPISPYFVLPWVSRGCLPVSIYHFTLPPRYPHGLRHAARELVELLVAVEFTFNRAFEYPCLEVFGPGGFGGAPHDPLCVRPQLAV